MNRIVFFMSILFVCTGTICSQTTYYSKSAGSLNLVGTWGINTDGTGTSPANFTTANCTYIIVNNVAATIAANWAVSGTSSVIQVGDGTQAIDFTIPTAFKVTGTIGVMNASTLTIASATNPTLGTLSAGSTVVYSDVAAQTVLNATYDNLTLSGSGTKTLANTASSTINNVLTINAGIAFALNTNTAYTLNLNGTLAGSGTITGGASANLSIGGTGNFGTILPTAAPLTLANFTLNRAGSGNIILGGNVTVSTSCNFSNGVLVLNGKTLTLNGSLTFPASSANGTITGSATSNLSIGATSITNNLFLTSGSQTLNNLTLNSSGQTLTLGNDLTVSGAYAQTKGIVNINGNTLTLSGTASFASSVANGTTSGSATSNLLISATTITNSLFMTVGAQTLNNFTLNSSGKTLTLGTPLTVSGAFTQTNGIISLNAQTLTLGGTVVFPAASANGTITGSATSSLAISATSITNNLFLTGGAQTFKNFTLNSSGQTLTLGAANNLTVSGAFTQTNGIFNINGNTLTLSGTIIFPVASSNGVITGSAASNISITATAITNSLFMDQTIPGTTNELKNLTLNTSGVTLSLGSNLIVSGAYAQTKGIVNINGNTLTLSGTASFASSVANGTTSGSATSNLLITAATITNSLFMTVGAQTLNNLTLNSVGKTLTLGTALTVSGAFTQTNGIINLNAQILTLSGTVTFPAASTNGTITGSATSDLIISATSITNNLFMTAAGTTLRNFTLNCAGQTVTLGSALTVAGAFTQTNGIFNINGNTLTLSGTVIFPIASSNGTISGSATSNISITATAITNNLYMTSGAQTLNNLTLNTSGVTLPLGSNLTVSGAYTQTKGIVNINGNTLTLSGTAIFSTTAANGTISGSATSNLLLSATTITNSLFMTVGFQTLNNFTLNSAGKTLTLGAGNNITVSGAFTQTNGILSLNGQSLTLSGTVVFPAASTNGTITGTAASNLTISATSITNDLFFTTGSQTLNNFTVNSSGQTLTMGTPLTVSGAFTHTSGMINLNGQTLTLNGAITFPTSAANGSFTGSSTSSLSIGGSGAITNSMYMTQTSSSTNSLNNITLNRTGQTLTLGNALNLIGTLTPTLGTFASAGNLTLIASSPTVTAWIGSIGATASVTGNVTVQTYAAGGNTGWALLGSAGITGTTFSNWNSSFDITCTNCPNGSAPGGSTFTSIDAYSETVGGVFGNPSRYIGISNITDPLTIGQGYWVYLGNGQTTTTDIVMNVTGPVNQGNYTYNLTLTGAANSDHGWNLISNPYPAPINWTSLRAGNAKVANSIYVYNADLNGFASYVAGVSSPAVGSGGIGNLIPAGQGFYVQVTGATTLVAKETFKGASTQQVLRTSNPNQTQSTSSPMVFRLQASGNAMKNETAIYFDANATLHYENEYDAISLGVDPGFLGIVSSLNDTDYAINGLPTLNQNFSIPVKTITGTTGSYKITATDLQNLPSGACLKLHDKYTNTDWDLRTGPYSCTLSDTETVARFVLNITIDQNLSVSSSFKNPTCSSSANGYMTASASGTAPWNYYWKDSANNIIQTSLNNSSSDTLKNANAGNYSVDVNTAGTCNNGTLTFVLQGAASPNALFSPSSNTLTLVNDTVTVSFTNHSANANTYNWNFGDGTVLSDTNALHQYTSPGTYLVILTAYNTICGDSSQYSQTITIDSSSNATGIKSFVANQSNMQISRDAAGYYVQFNYQSKTNAVISVQNLLGERVVTDIQQDNVLKNKTYVALGNADNNVLIISVITSAGEKTFRKVINY